MIYRPNQIVPEPMVEEKIDINLALQNTDVNKKQAGFLKDMINVRNKDNENSSDINKETPNAEFDLNIKADRGKSVKFQSNTDSLANRDSLAMNQNFFDDLQRNNLGQEYDKNGNVTKMRGLTKIAALLEDFNNEDDFKVQMEERRKTFADPDQSTDPVLNEEDKPDFKAFMDLV